MLSYSWGMTSNKPGCEARHLRLYRLSRHPLYSSIATSVGEVARSGDLATTWSGIARTPGSYSRPVPKLWDVATGEELLRFEGFSGTVCQPRFSRDGWALSALDLGGPVARPEVFLWQTTENEPPTPGLGQSTKPTP